MVDDAGLLAVAFVAFGLSVALLMRAAKKKGL